MLFWCLHYKFKYIWYFVLVCLFFFADFEHVMADVIFYCLNLNLSIYLKVQSRSPVTFKMKLYVLTVNNSFQPLAPSFMLHRGNWLMWHDPQNSKRNRGSPPTSLIIQCTLGKIWKTHPPRCPKTRFPKVFHITYFA